MRTPRFACKLPEAAYHHWDEPDSWVCWYYRWDYKMDDFSSIGVSPNKHFIYNHRVFPDRVIKEDVREWRLSDPHGEAWARAVGWPDVRSYYDWIDPLIMRHFGARDTMARAIVYARARGVRPKLRDIESYAVALDMYLESI